MNDLGNELADNIEEKISEEEFFCSIEHLNKRFLELEESNISNQDISYLIKQFEELQNQVIEKKNDGEYRTKDVRELFQNLISLCNGRQHIYSIIKLTAEEISDADFDIRDIPFKGL